MILKAMLPNLFPGTATVFGDTFRWFFKMKLMGWGGQETVHTQFRDTNSIIQKQMLTLNLNFGILNRNPLAGSNTVAIKLFGNSLGRLTKMLLIFFFKSKDYSLLSPGMFLYPHCKSEVTWVLTLFSPLPYFISTCCPMP